MLEVLVETGVTNPPIENENFTSFAIAIVKAFVIRIELLDELVTSAHFRPLFILRIAVQLLETALAEVIVTSAGKKTYI